MWLWQQQHTKKCTCSVALPENRIVADEAGRRNEKGESLDEHNKTTKQKKSTQEHIIIKIIIMNEVLQAFATFILLD